VTDRLAAKRAELQELHDRYHSWRQVQKLHFKTVPAGTLCAIAKGDPVPRKHRRALGLTGRREALPGERKMQRRIGKMARRTEEDVLIVREK
jgi:hypothetical protein